MKNKLRTKQRRNSGGGLNRVAAKSFSRRTFLKGALATAPLLLVGSSLLRPKVARAAQTFGPSTTTETYLVPSLPGVDITSILTTGDAIGGYRMVGIPDGLGTVPNGDGTFTLMMNHELGGTSGIVRGHGSRGAFVSRWTIDAKTLQVLNGEDFSKSPNDVFSWDPLTGQYLPGTTLWQRFCSGDLAKPGAFFFNGKGTQDRIYLNGEETTTTVNNVVVDQGRPWARIVTGPHTGETWQLPRLGRMAYENAVASPFPQDKTIVMLTDDSAQSTAAVINNNVPSEVYCYIGMKQTQGHPIEQAGLTNGNLYGIKVSNVTEESNDFGLGTAQSGFIGKARFSLQNLGDVSGLNNAVQLEGMSIDAGITRFQRPEDGAWDPREEHSNDYYFVTTASPTANARLWRLRFSDITRPEKGGSIEILLKGDEGHLMVDNVTIDRHGRILLDEDPGNLNRVSKIWLYQIDTGQFIEVARHNPKFFDPSIPNNPFFITQDEESSGIIDAEDILGRGWFLLDVQSHRLSADTELVEGGQLLALFVDPAIGAA
jgi:hypothetical protein